MNDRPHPPPRTPKAARETARGNGRPAPAAGEVTLSEVRNALAAVTGFSRPLLQRPLEVDEWRAVEEILRARKRVETPLHRSSPEDLDGDGSIRAEGAGTDLAAD